MFICIALDIYLSCCVGIYCDSERGGSGPLSVPLRVRLDHGIHPRDTRFTPELGGRRGLGGRRDGRGFELVDVLLQGVELGSDRLELLRRAGAVRLGLFGGGDGGLDLGRGLLLPRPRVGDRHVDARDDAEAHHQREEQQRAEEDVLHQPARDEGRVPVLDLRLRPHHIGEPLELVQVARERDALRGITGDAGGEVEGGGVDGGVSHGVSWKERRT